MKNVSNAKKNIKSKMIDNKGFTLIELLAAIAIMSLIVTISLFVATNVISSAKEKSYKVTISNLEREANSYVLEDFATTVWQDITGSNYQYQCITVNNLMDAGYFKSDVLDSYVSKDRKVQASDYIYLERDIETKAVTMNKYLYDDSLGLCFDFSASGSISFDISPSGWATEKNVTIKYKLFNLSGEKNVTDFDYKYDFYDLNVKEQFNNMNEDVTIKVSDNGELFAEIIDDDKIIKQATLNIDMIDKIKPTGNIASTNNIASKQKVTLTMEDGESGVAEYYFGIYNPDTTKVEWVDVEDSNSISINTEVSEGKTYYLGIKDVVGNMNVITKDFYETNLVISNATVEPIKIITMEGNSFNLSEVRVVEDEYYSFNAWYVNQNYTGDFVSTYTPSKNSSLYGKTTLNELIAGEVVIEGNVVYGNTLTAKITKDTTPKADEYYYQWYINDEKSITGGTKINGATGTTLELREEEFGKYIYVIVTALKENYWKYPESGVTFGTVTEETVGKRPLTVTANSKSKVYDGNVLFDWGCVANEYSSGIGLLDGYSVSCRMTNASKITDVGSIDNVISSVVVNDNTGYANFQKYYDITTVKGKLTITPKNATIPTASAYCKTGLVYNESEQVLTKDAGEGYNFINNIGVDAGTYDVNALLTNNYIWEDGTSTTKTLKCSIDKADSQLTLYPTVGTTKVGEYLDLNYAYIGDGELSCSSDDDSVATCSLDELNKIVRVNGKSTGSKYITISATEGRNYHSSLAKSKINVVEDPKYSVKIIYNVNGGDITPETIDSKNKYSWTLKNDVIYKNGELLTTSIVYENGSKLSGDGLINYNNEKYVEIIRDGYHVDENKEWICLSGNCIYDVYSQTVQYRADEICNATVKDCTIELGVNWQKNPPEEYKVNYDANGGSNAPDSQIKTEGVPLVLSSIKPTYEGHGFLEWNTSKDGTGTSFQSGDSFDIDADTTLYAQWKDYYVNIYYNANFVDKYNNDSGNVVSPTKSSDNKETFYWSVSEDGAIYKGNDKLVTRIKYGNTIAEYGLKDYNNENYLNILWEGHSVLGNEWICLSGNCNINGGIYSQNDEGYTSSDFCDASKSDCDVVLGVNWQIDKYTITYDANASDVDAIPDNQEKVYSVSMNLSSEMPTRTGYTFKSWNTEKNGTGDSFAPNGIFTKNADTTLYAQWNLNTYTISYNANGGTGAPEPQTKYYGKDINLSDVIPTRQGYTFLGWGISSTSTNVSYQSGEVFSDNNNTTLYAIWELNSYTISYDANGGTGAPKSQTKYYNEDVYLSEVIPVRQGYTFKSWNTKKDGTGDSFVTNGEFTRNVDMILYAQWDLNTYIITYNANGGSEAPKSQTKNHGEDVVLTTNVPVWEGHKFKSWNTKNDGTGDSYTSGSSFSKDANTTLYAIWELNSYTISYNANGGTGAPSSQTKYYGQDINLSTDIPTRQGYTFLGWGISSTSTNVSYLSGASFSSNKNTTLYAVWKKNYKVTIYYHISSAGFASTAAGGYYWNVDNGLIKVNDSLLTTTVTYGSKLGDDGLYNYNNSDYLNLKRNGYGAVSEAEWKCKSGGCEGKTYSQTNNQYTSNDFCNAEANDCEVILEVNWEDNEPPKVTVNIEGYKASDTNDDNVPEFNWTTYPDSNQWYTQKVKFNITVTDNVSTDLNTFKYTITGDDDAVPNRTFNSGEDYVSNVSTGDYYLIVKACDKTGNCTTYTSQKLLIDTVAPVIKCTSQNAEHYQYIKEFNSSGVSCTLLTDKISGVTYANYGPNLLDRYKYDSILGKLPSSIEKPTDKCFVYTRHFRCAAHYVSSCANVLSVSDNVHGNSVSNYVVNKCSSHYRLIKDKTEDVEIKTVEATGTGYCTYGPCKIISKRFACDQAGNCSEKEFIYYMQFGAEDTYRSDYPALRATFFDGNVIIGMSGCNPGVEKPSVGDSCSIPNDVDIPTKTLDGTSITGWTKTKGSCGTNYKISSSDLSVAVTEKEVYNTNFYVCTN